MKGFSFCLSLFIVFATGIAKGLDYGTLLIKSENERKNAMLDFKNSSSSIKNAALSNYNDGGVINVGVLSNICLYSVVLIGRGMIDIPIECSGIIMRITLS